MFQGYLDKELDDPLEAFMSGLHSQMEADGTMETLKEEKVRRREQELREAEERKKQAEEKPPPTQIPLQFLQKKSMGFTSQTKRFI